MYIPVGHHQLFEVVRLTIQDGIETVLSRDVSDNADLVAKLVNLFHDGPVTSAMLADALAELDRQEGFRLSGLHSKTKQKAYYRAEAQKVHALWWPYALKLFARSRTSTYINILHLKQHIQQCLGTDESSNYASPRADGLDIQCSASTASGGACNQTTTQQRVGAQMPDFPDFFCWRDGSSCGCTGGDLHLLPRRRSCA